MSIRSTKLFLDEHAALRDSVEHLPVAARDLPRLDHEERVELVERVVAFLADILLPHAAAEERVLYPEAARLLGEPDASDAVAADRVEIRNLLGRLANARTDDVGVLQEVLFALYAILAAHLWREEEVYLKLVRGRVTDARAVLDRVADAGQRRGRFTREGASGAVAPAQ